MLNRYRFAPSPVYTLLMLLLFGLLISLGLWQLDRANQKREIDSSVAYAQSKPPLLLNKISPTNTEKETYRKARAQGYYDSNHQYLLDNRTHKGRPGYHVYTPFLLTGRNDLSTHKPVGILVNRGWIPYQGTRDNIPDIQVASETRMLTGTIKQAPRTITLGNVSYYASSSFPKTIQSVSLMDIEKELGLTLFPVIIELAKDDDDGFVRDWQPYYGSVDKHKAYAAQWFAMATILLLIYLKLSFKRTSRIEF